MSLGSPKSDKSSIWRALSQRELDAAYDQSVWAPNMQSLHARRAFLCEHALARLGEPHRVAYGQGPIEHIDIYRAKVATAPIAVFIHGGAWRGGSARECAFLAEPFVNAGATFVALDFSSVIEADGSLAKLHEQVKSALSWIFHNAADAFDGDPERIHLIAHSSGAHLAGTLLTVDWSASALPQSIVTGAVLVSGIYDLAPVRLSARSEYVKITDEVEHQLSPERHVQRIACPVVVIYGSRESPEFKRQSDDFSHALQRAGKSVQQLFAEEYNHFEILETLANPYGIVGQAALSQMGLAGNRSAIVESEDSNHE